MKRWSWIRGALIAGSLMLQACGATNEDMRDISSAEEADTLSLRGSYDAALGPGIHFDPATGILILQANTARSDTGIGMSTDTAIGVHFTLRDNQFNVVLQDRQTFELSALTHIYFFSETATEHHFQDSVAAVPLTFNGGTGGQGLYFDATTGVFTINVAESTAASLTNNHVVTSRLHTAAGHAMTGALIASTAANVPVLSQSVVVPDAQVKSYQFNGQKGHVNRFTNNLNLPTTSYGGEDIQAADGRILRSTNSLQGGGGPDRFILSGTGSTAVTSGFFESAQAANCDFVDASASSGTNVYLYLSPCSHATLGPMTQLIYEYYGTSNTLARVWPAGRIDLTWETWRFPGAQGVNVFRDGAPVPIVYGSVSERGLAPATWYTYTVEFYDANQVLLRTSSVRARTQAAPTIALTSPVNGATVSGVVQLLATAEPGSVDAPIRSVQFFCASGALGTVTTAPYSLSWDTSAYHGGTCSLTAKATDAAGNFATSAPIAVTFNNTTSSTPSPTATPQPTPVPTPIPTSPPQPTPIPTSTPTPRPSPLPTPLPTPMPTDTVAPTVFISSPMAGAIVARRSTLLIKGSATDDSGRIDRMQVYVNSTLVCLAPSANVECYYSVPGKPGATYTVKVEAVDARGNVGNKTVTITSTK